MPRLSLLLSLLLLGLPSCGRFEYKSKLSCSSPQDCPEGSTCQEGFCRQGTTVGPSPCPPPHQLCQGACVEVQNNNAHCGSCNQACPGGFICQATSCVPEPNPCTPPHQLCQGACVEVQNNNTHCGGCNQTCPGGFICQAASCVPEVPEPEPCLPPHQLCEGNCVDIQTNSAHCGGCNNRCPTNTQCQQGQCVCPGNNRVLCNGVCQTPTIDMLFVPSFCGGECGTDGTRCPSGMLCQLGRCVNACYTGNFFYENTLTLPFTFKACGNQCLSSIHC